MSVHSSAGGSYIASFSEELHTLMVQEKKLGAQVWYGGLLLIALTVIGEILAWTMGCHLLALAVYGLSLALFFVYRRLFTIHRHVDIFHFVACKLLTFEDVAELNVEPSVDLAILLRSLNGALNWIDRDSRMLSWCPKHQELVRHTLIVCGGVLKVLGQDPKFSVLIRAYPRLTKLVENV